MTAYQLFRKIYFKYMGNFMRHLWTADKETNPKDYIIQSFNEALGEYSVDYAYSNGIKLSYDGNFASISILDLQQIEMQQGYYLCYHDGHTDWLLMYFDSKSGAKAAYKKLYNRYFRHQDWYHIIVVRGGTHQ